MTLKATLQRFGTRPPKVKSSTFRSRSATMSASAESIM